METPYQVTWTSTWGAGWTQLVPFQPDDLPYFIAYSATTVQRVRFSSVSRSWNPERG